MKKAKAPSSSGTGLPIVTDPDIVLARAGDLHAIDRLFYRAQCLVRNFSITRGIEEDEARAYVTDATVVVVRQKVLGGDRPMNMTFFLSAVFWGAANLLRAERREQQKIAFSLDELGAGRDEFESAAKLRSRSRRHDRYFDEEK